MQSWLLEKVAGNVGYYPILPLPQREFIAVPFHSTFEPVLACCFFGDLKWTGDYILDS
jgi:hypothetical protein